MDDEADGRLDAGVADQPVGSLVPVGCKVAELAVVDDDQKIEVRPVALYGEGFIDPATLGVGAEEDDLQDPATFLEAGCPL